jgi:hypothetical protein
MKHALLESERPERQEGQEPKPNFLIQRVIGRASLRNILPSPRDLYQSYAGGKPTGKHALRNNADPFLVRGTQKITRHLAFLNKVLTS